MANDDWYVPTQGEIADRCEAMRWMKLMDWSIAIQDAILVRDNPDLETVRRLVYQHGPHEARRRIIFLLEDF